MMRLTDRQQAVLQYLSDLKASGSRDDYFVLRTLESKGLVRRSHGTSPEGWACCFWKVTDKGIMALTGQVRGKSGAHTRGLDVEPCAGRRPEWAEKLTNGELMHPEQRKTLLEHAAQQARKKV